MSSLEEVILHVGLHKTGTSTIQDSLFIKENLEKLLHHDVFYPDMWEANHSPVFFSAFCDNPENYHVNIFRKYTKEQIKELNKLRLSELIEKTTLSKCSKLLISAEGISVLTRDNIEKMKDFFISSFVQKIKFTVIIYVRHPISWAVSSIQQSIRGAGNTYNNALDIISNVMKNLYQSRIQKFMDVFGKENVRICKFEDGVSCEGGLLRHFTELAGFGDMGLKEIRTNEGSSMLAINILSYINERIPMILNGKLNPKRFGNDYKPFLKIGGRKFDIPYTDKLKLLNTSDLEWLKENCDVEYNIHIEKNELDMDVNPDLIKDIIVLLECISDDLKKEVIDYLKNNFNDEIVELLI